ncbi:hypothetical protein AVEN_184184-1 [Araneus ventricosus]|uniref:Uncharacterized protein n=1 Tax=Araneus ventricosus TaxID=182803 RepID=A0A4Y2VYB9_ARAVE|nr:hypothetical protein AVEN_184184-1 [Araneus ventricosus]
MADLQWNRVSNLEPSGPKTKTLPLGHRGLLQHNEIANYIDARYLSAHESMWRLLESHMYDRSHAVMRLPVHLPSKECVAFKDGQEEEALEATRSRQKMLESWFQ